MGRHCRPRIACIGIDHDGPAVFTERGTCCGSCGVPVVPARLVNIPNAGRQIVSMRAAFDVDPFLGDDFA